MEVGDKRFREGGNKNYDIKKLWESHQQILRLVSLGETNVEIAQELGITPQTVSNIRNSSLAKQQLEVHKEKLDKETVNIGKRIQEFVPVALEVLEQIIDGTFEEASLHLRGRHAEAYLARAGYGQVHKVHSINEHISREEIEKIKARAINAAKNAGALVLEKEEFSEVEE